ncbi:MAG: SOS response-associated peptidase [Pseudomonadota bacterium]
MCSRYSLTSPPEAVRATFRYDNEERFPPRYNIAPTQPVAIVRTASSGKREFALVRWGLIPSWVKDPATFSTLINARSETAVSKPSFRAAMRHRRCLVPADAYYEWTGPQGAKQPHMVRLAKGGPFGIAGIWEHWLGPDGSEIETMAILTTTASRSLAWLHDRMPVIVPPEAYELWLDCRSGSARDAEALLVPARDGLLETIAISPRLNNPRNEGPEVQAPVGGR